MKKDIVLNLLKLPILICALILVSLTFSNSASAQTSTPSSSQTVTQNPKYNLNTNPDVPQNLNTYTQATFIEMLSTVSCFLTGSNPINPASPCLGVDQETGKLGYVESQGGAIVFMGNLIAQTYNIPVSTASYGSYLASNFGITQTSYAQFDQGPGSSPAGRGVGFMGLQSILPIWIVFRNLTYLIFVLVFILLGLGIMFRINIDARTVMTIQNQIPKIIIGLLLITLSYAIAGFLIDLMFVTTYLLINLFDQQGLATITNVNTNPMSAVGYFGGIHGIAAGPATSAANVIASLFDGTIGRILAGVAGVIAGTFLGGALAGVPFIGPLATGVGIAAGGIGGVVFADTIISSVSMVVAYLIIVIAIFSALFRTWIMLIKAYVYIILGIIFSPFWILAGLLPFGTGGFGPWIRSLISNLAAFPVVVLLFMVGKSIIDTMNNLQESAINPYNFNPPLIGDLGEGSVSAITSLVGLGIILILPEALNLTKSVLKAPDFKLTSAAGRAIGVGGAVVSKPFSGAREELFGKNWNNDPKIGSRWLGSTASRLLGRRGGKVIQFASGGGLEEQNQRSGVRHIQDFNPRSVLRGGVFGLGNRNRNNNRDNNGGTPDGGGTPPATNPSGNAGPDTQDAQNPDNNSDNSSDSNTRT